jgi:hypothetical protein
MYILDDYAIADPARDWTVETGQACGDEVLIDAASLVSVHRRTGLVGEPAWIAGTLGWNDPWEKRDGEWVRVEAAIADAPR